MENGAGNNGPLTKQDLIELEARFGERVDKMGERLTEMGERLTEMGEHLTEKMRDIETNLLTEFHRYAKGVAQRLHTQDHTNGELRERLHLVEERLLELERRIRPQI